MTDKNDDEWIFPNPPSKFNGNYYDLLLNQYKLYVEMANAISERRSKANTFFLSANSFLITTLGVLTKFQVENNLGFFWLYIASTAGILFAVTWLLLVRNYKQLNSSKYQVIHDIEKKLPASPYIKEWRNLDSGKNWKKYMKLTNIESIIPILFIALYLILSIGTFFLNSQ